MNLNVSLSAEVENALSRKAASVGKDVSTFVQDVIVENVSDQLLYSQPRKSHEDFMSRLRGIIAKHAIFNGHVDDSRESIYAGCGE